MKELQAFIIGFCATFSFIVFMGILFWIWPVPLNTFTGPPYYPIRDTEIAILLTATFCGSMIGLVTSAFTLMDEL